MAMSAKRSKTRVKVNVNDLFEEISDENKRLKKLVNILLEFEEYCDSVVSQLDANDIQRYQGLKLKLNQLKDSELRDVLNRAKTGPDGQPLYRRRRNKNISNDMRISIIKMLDEGHKAIVVANKFSVDVNTIKSMYWRYQKTGIVYNRKTTDFRPKVFNTEQEAEIRQWYLEEPTLTLHDLKYRCQAQWPDIKDITTDAIRKCFTEINTQTETENQSQSDNQYNSQDFNQFLESSIAVEAITENNKPEDNNESAIEETNDGTVESEAEDRVVKEEQQSRHEKDEEDQRTEIGDNSETEEANEGEDKAESDSNDQTKTKRKRRRNKCPPMSVEMRGLAVKMIDNGTEISKVAKIFGRDKATIRSIYKVYQQRGTFEKVCKAGRIKSLSEEQVKQLQQWFTDDPSLSLNELRDKMFEKWPDIKKISTMTVSRCLRETTQTVKRIVKYKRKVEEGPFLCPICSKEFCTKGSMKTHIETHNTTRPYTCNQCAFAAKTKNGLQSHIETMHEPNVRSYRCQYDGCGKDFRTNYALKSHMEAMHAPPETVNCTFEGCTRVLKNRRSLKVHLDNFHGEANVCCEWPGCDYKTTSRYKLPAHRMVHVNERNFVCDWTQCGKQFKTKKYLEDHQRIHTNDRKYVCSWPGCNFSCVLSGNLSKHVKVHRK